MRGSSCNTEVCQREFSCLQAEYLRLEDTLHDERDAIAIVMSMVDAERESNAAQVSAMLEERDQLQEQVEGLRYENDHLHHEMDAAHANLEAAEAEADGLREAIDGVDR